MVGIDPDRKSILRGDREEDPQLQLINRLKKQHEDLTPEDQRVQVIADIDRMDLTESDRQELLRRFE